MSAYQASGADKYMRPEGAAIFPWERRNAVLDHIAREFVDKGFKAGNDLAYWYGLQVIADLSAMHSESEELADGIQRFIDAWQAKAVDALTSVGKQNWIRTEGDDRCF